MADDQNPIFGNVVDENSWSLEETQLKILAKVQDYVDKTATKDSKNLDLISKNIAKITGHTSSQKEILEELKNIASQGHMKQTSALTDVQNIMSKADKKRSQEAKEQKDLTEKEARQQLMGRTGVTGALSATSEGLGRLDRSAGGVIKSFASFDGKLSTFAGAILGGGVIGSLVGVLTNNVDTYRELYNVGQSFNGRMLDMNRAAADAGLSLQQVAELTKKHSRVIATVGIDSVLDQQKAVREMLKPFGQFGLTLEQITEFQALNLQNLVMQGRIDALDNNQRKLATANYLKQITDLAEATGLQREQIAEEINERNRNVKLFAMLNALPPEIREQFGKTMEVFNLGLVGLPKAASDQLLETALLYKKTGSFVQSELGAAIAMIGGTTQTTFENLMQAVASADPTATASALADFRDVLRGAGVSAKERQRIEDLILLGEVKGVETFAEVQQAAQLATEDHAETLRDIAHLSTKEYEAEAQRKREEADKEQKATESILNAQSELSKAFGRIQLALVEGLGPAFNEIVNSITSWLRELDPEKVKAVVESLKTIFEKLGQVAVFVANNFEWLIGIFVALKGLQIVSSIVGMVGGFKLVSSALGGAGGRGLLGSIGRLGRGLLGIAGRAALPLAAVTGAGAVAQYGGEALTEAVGIEEGGIWDRLIERGLTGAAAGGAGGAFFGGIGAAPGALIGGGLGLASVAGEEAWKALFGGGEEVKAEEHQAATTGQEPIVGGTVAAEPRVSEGTAPTIAGIDETAVELSTAEEDSVTLQLLKEIKQTLEQQNHLLMDIMSSNRDTAKYTKGSRPAVGDDIGFIGGS